MIDATTILRIRPGFRLQWEDAQQAHILLYPEGMVKLNPSAAAILLRCDGLRSIDDIVVELKTEFPDVSDLANDVYEFLAVAIEKGWVDSER